MDRRSFLRNIGLTGVGIAVAPFVSFEPPKRMIYKVERPVFQLWYDKQYKDGVRCVEMDGKVVTTYKGTLKELCDRHPNDEIFFYEENKNNEFNYVRAAVIKKRPGLKVSPTSSYNPMYV